MKSYNQYYKYLENNDINYYIVIDIIFVVYSVTLIITII